MDNNFSTQVKEIISYSREEALRLGNDFIGAEHLMLGLIRDQENTAIKVLRQLNVNLTDLRKEIELAVKDKSGKNVANINSLPLTKQAEKVILVTATPLNNTVDDIFAQIKLFQAPKQSTIPGVPNLEKFFTSLNEPNFTNSPFKGKLLDLPRFDTA